MTYTLYSKCNWNMYKYIECLHTINNKRIQKTYTTFSNQTTIKLWAFIRRDQVTNLGSDWRRRELTQLPSYLYNIYYVNIM